jgi:predicted nucleotidyltransferase
MCSSLHDSWIGQLARVAATHRGLRLLVLFGSRARGNVHASSDWDLGYLANRDFDPLALLADLGGTLATDRIDLVDLARAGAQLRFRAAAEGRLIYAADPVTFPRFWMEAVRFWCDAAPVIEAGYHGVLIGLGG